jgi:hypothetical protein
VCSGWHPRRWQANSGRFWVSLVTPVGFEMGVLKFFPLCPSLGSQHSPAICFPQLYLHNTLSLHMWLFCMNCLTGPEDESSTVLQNVRNYLPIDTASCPRRLECCVSELLPDTLYSSNITLCSCYICLLLNCSHIRDVVQAQVASKPGLRIV